MKDLFLKALGYANAMGRIIEAFMYQSGEYATVKFDTVDAVYSISITKEIKTDGDS